MTINTVDSHWRHQNYEWTYVELCIKQKCEITENMFHVLDVSKYPPFALVTALHTLGILSMSFMRQSPERVFQQSWRSSQRPWALVGPLAFTLRSSSPQTSGLGSGQVSSLHHSPSWSDSVGYNMNNWLYWSNEYQLEPNLSGDWQCQFVVAANEKPT